MEQINTVLHDSNDNGGDVEQSQDNQEVVNQESVDDSGNVADETTVGAEKVPFHKDPNVQEYIERQIEKRLTEFEKKNKQTTEPVEDPDYQELIALGFGEKEAKRTLAIMDARAKRTLTPFQTAEKERQVTQSLESFKTTHSKELNENVWSEMNALSDKFTEEQQRALFSNPLSLELFYAYVKSKSGIDYNKGKQDGVLNAKRKKDGGNMSGSPAGDTELTEEAIANMSDEEFSRRSKEISAKVRQYEREQE